MPAFNKIGVIKGAKENSADNHGHHIFRHFDIWPNLPFK